MRTRLLLLLILSAFQLFSVSAFSIEPGRGAGPADDYTQRVIIASDSPVSPAGYTSSASKPRSSDTNAYTAGDVLSESASAGTVWTFENLGPSGGRIMLTSVSIRWDAAALPSGANTFRVHLYDAAPTAINDNAAYDLPSGDRTKYLGYVDIPPPSDLGATLWGQDDTVRKQLKLASASTSLYAIVEQLGAYTPTSAAVYTITLRATKLAD